VARSAIAGIIPAHEPGNLGLTSGRPRVVQGLLKRAKAPRGFAFLNLAASPDGNKPKRTSGHF
jgi:hypothetical protein